MKIITLDELYHEFKKSLNPNLYVKEPRFVNFIFKTDERGFLIRKKGKLLTKNFGEFYDTIKKRGYSIL